MYIELKFKKLGNHWYVDTNHNDPNEVSLSEKVERAFNILTPCDFITLFFSEQSCILNETTLQFRDEDITRYFTTSDDFDLIIYIGEKSFPISSTLYTLLEENYNFNFHKELYSVNYEI